MNLLEIIADVIETPKGAYDRMLDMGLDDAVINHVLALLRDNVPVAVLRNGKQTTLVFE